MSTTSPYRTSVDLVNRALVKLGVLAVGQPTSVEDFSRINDNLDSFFRKIAANEICYIPDPDNIPGAWFEDLAAIVAGLAADDFAYTGQDLSDKIAAGLGGPPSPVPLGAGAAALSLKSSLRGRPTYEALRTYSY